MLVWQLGHQQGMVNPLSVPAILAEGRRDGTGVPDLATGHWMILTTFQSLTGEFHGYVPLVADDNGDA